MTIKVNPNPNTSDVFCKVVKCDFMIGDDPLISCFLQQKLRNSEGG